VLLVVDDDDLTPNVTARMLMTAGYLVLTAASGDDALRIVEDDLSGAVELVIADVMMPGMNGPEVAERLRQTASPPSMA
jgi:two-component system, cell cycle sensor histidine kinase and response regulator CckA